MARKNDLSRFTGTLPYASEMFGIYRPMIGWNSKRKRDRMSDAQSSGIQSRLMSSLVPNYLPMVDITWVEPAQEQVDALAPGRIRNGRTAQVSPGDSVLLDALGRSLREMRGPDDPPESPEEWAAVLDESVVMHALREPVQRSWISSLGDRREEARNRPGPPHESDEARADRIERELEQVAAEAQRAIEHESAVAGMVLDLVNNQAIAVLEKLFYHSNDLVDPSALSSLLERLQRELVDPFSQFDPTVGLPGVSVSPIGIVHLFRQYFFEFDTFLGTPVGHVWLSKGSTVELIESSTRKTTVERTVATEYESRTQTERSTRGQEELSEAVKAENREDTKLGFSTTVTQSWGTGSATATGSLNLDSTQQEAREDIHKRMREQSEKLSTDIRNLYKTTFKTVTETTDVSSKRYVLANEDDDLINYEMRRKMRQVGVQVQDVGTYLCWETFIDEPGGSLGLANLVHIAKPGDLAPQPNSNEIPAPPPIPKAFMVQAAWVFKARQFNGPAGPVVPDGPIVPGHVLLGTTTMPFDIDPGYVIGAKLGAWIPLRIRNIHGDQGQRYEFIGVWTGERELRIGVVAGSLGIHWDEPVGFDLDGELTLVPSQDKLKDIADANTKITQDLRAATNAQQRANDDAAFYTAAKERIEQASTIKQRPFEDLREEERTIVYRELIRDLMAKDATTAETGDDNYDTATHQRRHVYSTALNAIFDIDKMLYFVAPEWWKPRPHYGQYLGRLEALPLPASSVVNWSDNEERVDNYYITSESEEARLGSSLGWLLQLDGDDNRNRFLNAPWVRTVIPIRPGKEQAAISWLSKANVEGVDGLNGTYAETSEYEEIRTGLQDEGLPVDDPPTIGDAIRYLCLRVAAKHAESSKVMLFPDRQEVPDEDKVWSTPVDKVYEHGFYPLERSFRIDPREEPVDAKGSTNFHCMQQWTEILPTDQIVPVAVKYDPKDGRQVNIEENE